MSAFHLKGQCLFDLGSFIECEYMCGKLHEDAFVFGLCTSHEITHILLQYSKATKVVVIPSGVWSKLNAAFNILQARVTSQVSAVQITRIEGQYTQAAETFDDGSITGCAGPCGCDIQVCQASTTLQSSQQLVIGRSWPPLIYSQVLHPLAAGHSRLHSCCRSRNVEVL
jgi:hypothetical protein